MNWEPAKSVIADLTIRNDRLVLTPLSQLMTVAKSVVKAGRWYWICTMVVARAVLPLIWTAPIFTGTDQYGRENDNTGDLLGGTTVASGKKLGDLDP
ncbi:MAG: hypothetical protein R3F53_16995 [Gammaproteobacteria bacterium]